MLYHPVDPDGITTGKFDFENNAVYMHRLPAAAVKRYIGVSRYVIAQISVEGDTHSLVQYSFEGLTEVSGAHNRSGAYAVHIKKELPE